MMNDTENSKCPLCPKNGFYLYNILSDKFTLEFLTVFKTPNFLVVPDIAPIVEGHLLLITAKHYLSSGEVINRHYNEFNTLKQHTARALTQVYQSPIFLEHGSVFDKEAGNSIVHAHMHCVPFSTRKQIDINGGMLPRVKSPSLNTLGEYAKGKKPYLYLETGHGESYVYPVNSAIPSQFWRRVVATEIGVKQWDWRASLENESREIYVKMICE